MDIDSFDKISFQYTTGQVPPPFCFRYVIDVSLVGKDKYEGKLELEYFDRDELTEDEIFDEGFSLEDNFSWQGVIPKVWGDEVVERIKSTNWRKNLSANNDGSEFLIKLYKNENGEVLQPSDINSWEMFMQEIMQAVFELGKKEAPLMIGFSKNDKSQQIQFDITYYFSRRCVDIIHNNNKKNIDWSEAQKLLKYIFGIDYVPEQGLEKLPKSHGAFISPGDGLWYLLNPEGGQGKEASKIKRLTDYMLTYIN